MQVLYRVSPRSIQFLVHPIHPSIPSPLRRFSSFSSSSFRVLPTTHFRSNPPLLPRLTLTTVLSRSVSTRTLPSYSSPSPSSSSSSAPASVPRPKAVTESPRRVQQREQKTVVYAILLLTLGLAAPIIYVMRDQQLSFTEVIDYVMEELLEMGEYDDSDIRSLLPSIETNPSALSSSSSSSTEPKGRSTKIPVATVITGWEGTLVDIVYHPKAGPMAIPRPGMDKFLLTCANQSIELVIWSKEYTSTTVQDQLKHIIQGVIIPLDKERYNLFNDQLNYHYKEAKAMEVALAYKEKRNPRPLPDIDNNERPNYYIKNMLNIVAVLGKDHCKTIYPNTNLSTTPTIVHHVYRKIRSARSIRPYQLLIQRRYLTNPVLIMDNDLTVRSPLLASVVQNAFVLTLGTWKSPDSVDAQHRHQREMYREDPTLVLCSYLFERYVPWKQRKKSEKEPAKHHNGWFQRSPSSSSSSGSPSDSPVPAASDSPSFTIVDYIQDIMHQSIQFKLKPSTGSPIDDTVGLLGMILKDMNDEEERKGK